MFLYKDLIMVEVRNDSEYRMCLGWCGKKRWSSHPGDRYCIKCSAEKDRRQRNSSRGEMKVHAGTGSHSES